MSARECGASRTAGGVYVEVGLSPLGTPLKDFLVCPPTRVALDVFGLSAVGVKLLPVGGVYHVFDVVGEKYYPNVLDILEEGRRLGFSRRCELSRADYAKLGPNSRLVLIHRRALIENAGDYYRALIKEGDDGLHCVAGRQKHDEDFPRQRRMCSMLWAHDVEGGTPSLAHPRGVVKALACGAHVVGRRRPEGVTPDYHYAIFASLPITRFALVDPDRTHSNKLDKLAGTALPVSVEEN